jgi:FkbM family methyltransferase
METSMKSYSQAGEDNWIMENLKPPVGTFCEVGAFDGVKSSNTMLFEEAGWTGLCIEADPFNAAICQINRKSPTWCCAVGLGVRGEFCINEQDRGLSGFNRPGRRTMVIIMRLDLLLNYKAPDLLSIDTEGTELEVWDSIGELRPKIVIMEYQTCDEPPQDAAIVKRMTADGYTEVHRTKHNIIFQYAPR